MGLEAILYTGSYIHSGIPPHLFSPTVQQSPQYWLIGSGNVKLKEGRMMKELEALFHPNRYASVEINGKVIGGLAEVHPRFLNNFGIEKRVAILEISIESLIN